MSGAIRAIAWAQWRSFVNFYLQSVRGSAVLAGLVFVVWYGLWAAGSVLLARALAKSTPGSVLFVNLGPAFFVATLYSQAAPFLLAATGVSLAVRRLWVYPVPVRKLFWIQASLRTVAVVDILIVFAGAAVGLAFNTRLAWYAPLGVAALVIWNVLLSAGLSDLLMRLFERKYLRELAILTLALLGALPQLLLLRPFAKVKLPAVLGLPVMPWSAAAAIAGDRNVYLAALSLALWLAAAYAFGLWQFHRTLRFEPEAANATRSDSPSRANWLLDAIVRLPSRVVHDPIAAMTEKELRVFARAPRFRLVFVMGFTLAPLLWLPLMLRSGSGSPAGGMFLTLASLYSLLLLDVCYFNVLGFDRSAAQLYWAAPVRFCDALKAKNLAALIAIAAEVSLIAMVCAVLRLDLNPARLAEAYTAALVSSLYLLAFGNLTSTRWARAANPSHAMRQSGGRVRAFAGFLYPLSMAGTAVAYLARYAFSSEAAWFGVMAVWAAVGCVAYVISLESAVRRAARDKERLIADLSRAEGVVSA